MQCEEIWVNGRRYLALITILVRSAELFPRQKIVVTGDSLENATNADEVGISHTSVIPSVLHQPVAQRAVLGIARQQTPR